MEEIVCDNKELKVHNILFSKEYYWFVRELLDSMAQFDKGHQKQILKYVIAVFLTITVREKS